MWIKFELPPNCSQSLLRFLLLETWNDQEYCYCILMGRRVISGFPPPPFLSSPSSPLAHLYSWVERGSVTVKCFSKVNSTIVLIRIRTLTMWLWVWYLNVNRRASMFDPKGRGVGSQLRCFYWSIRCDVQSTSNNRCNWCFVVPQEFKTFAMDLTSPPPGYSSCHGVRNTDNEPSDFKVCCVGI